MGYPDIFSPFTGEVNVTEGGHKANQHLSFIIGTPLGTILGMPEFGSRVKKLQFEPFDEVWMDRAELYIQEALERWAPWCSIIKFEFEYLEGDRGRLSEDFHKVHIIMYYYVAGSADQSRLDYEMVMGGEV